MTHGIEHRAVTPIIDAIRIALRGRVHKNSLRYADNQVSRTQPQPDLPGGPYHRTSKIYYFTRDARREVNIPIVIASASTKQITARKEDTDGQKKALIPGKAYQPDQI